MFFPSHLSVQPPACRQLGPDSPGLPQRFLTEVAGGGWELCFVKRGWRRLQHDVPVPGRPVAGLAAWPSDPAQTGQTLSPDRHACGWNPQLQGSKAPTTQRSKGAPCRPRLPGELQGLWIWAQRKGWLEGTVRGSESMSSCPVVPLRASWTETPRVSQPGTESENDFPLSQPLASLSYARLCPGSVPPRWLGRPPWQLPREELDWQTLRVHQGTASATEPGSAQRPPWEDGTDLGPCTLQAHG